MAFASAAIGSILVKRWNELSSKKTHVNLVKWVRYLKRSHLNSLFHGTLLRIHVHSNTESCGKGCSQHAPVDVSTHLGVHHIQTFCFKPKLLQAI